MRGIACVAAGVVLAVCVPLEAQIAEQEEELRRIVTDPERFADLLDESYGLGATEVRELEAHVERLPSDQVARARLLAYYGVRQDAENYVRHVFWLIGRAPASPLFQSGLAPGRDSRQWVFRTAEYRDRAAALWKEQAARHWSDPGVLRLAGSYLLTHSPWEAERIAVRLHDLEPSGTALLAALYAGAVQTSAISGRGAPAPQWHDQKFAEHALETLERSNDTELLSAVVDRIVPSPPISERHRAHVLAFSNLELADRLLERAASLDPANPRWRGLRERMDSLRQ